MIIQSERVWVNSTFMPLQVEIIDGVIKRINSHGAKEVDVDYGNYRILPGFIDVHTHGAFGAQVNPADYNGMVKWCKKLPEEGVTSFLATTTTDSVEVLRESMRNVKRVKEENIEGAQIIGAHIEGPFINTKYKGAQNEEYILKPSIETFDMLMEDSGGNIKYITVAPEVDSDFGFLHHAIKNNVVVSIGHSCATFDEAMLYVANGASSFTHTFNAMTPLNHRNPGCVGAIMSGDSFCELIFDGQHVNKHAIKILFETKGRDRIVLISDSLGFKGCEEKEFNFDGQTTVITDKGVAIIKGTNTIAGSTLYFNQGLKFLVEEALVPFGHAIDAMTKNPAALLKRDNIGSIRVHCDGDLVVIDDLYNVKQTYCKGNAVLSISIF